MKKLLALLPPAARVLDYGCFGWKLTNITNRSDLEYHGCDIILPDGKPSAAIFHKVDPVARKIDVEDNFFDLVIASHVLEHVTDPIDLFQELGRVCKPGGKIYIETPSDRSAMVKSDGNIKSHSFYSFWDDPTHIRPYSPAALYRLAIGHGYKPLQVKYITSLKDKFLFPMRWVFYSFTKNGHKLTDALWAAIGWSCFAIIEKPFQSSGKPIFKYVSLKDIPRDKN